MHNGRNHLAEGFGAHVEKGLEEYNIKAELYWYKVLEKMEKL